MTTLHVLFTVGDAAYVVAASEVVQMESFTGVTPVPGVAPYVAGLVQVRGSVVPVIDLRVRFGLPPIARDLGARLIVMRRGERQVALLADAAREVVRLEPTDFAPPPAVVQEQSRGLVDAVATANKRLVMRLDFDKVIGRELEEREAIHGQQAQG